jgi:hypothetical protein
MCNPSTLNQVGKTQLKVVHGGHPCCCCCLQYDRVIIGEVLPPPGYALPLLIIITALIGALDGISIGAVYGEWGSCCCCGCGKEMLFGIAEELPFDPCTGNSSSGSRSNVNSSACWWDSKIAWLAAQPNLDAIWRCCWRRAPKASSVAALMVCI